MERGRLWVAVDRLHVSATEEKRKPGLLRRRERAKGPRKQQLVQTIHSIKWRMGNLKKKGPHLKKNNSLS